MPSIYETGGRGSGRPPDRIQYGKRKCQQVGSYRTFKEAWRVRNKFEADGILAIVRKWYKQWVVYRCGVRKRGR